MLLLRLYHTSALVSVWVKVLNTVTDFDWSEVLEILEAIFAIGLRRTVGTGKQFSRDARNKEKKVSQIDKSLMS